MEIIERDIKTLIPYINNARTHDAEQVKQIAASIREFGFNNPVLIDADGGIIAGHGRVQAAQLLNLETVPTIELPHLTETQKKAYILADNKIALNAGWDIELLQLELKSLVEDDFDITLTGFDLDDIADEGEEAQSEATGGKGSLADRFIIPPFSVLNAREGWWQDRKKAWLALGIESEKGRGEGDHHAAPGGSPMVAGYDSSGKRLVGLKSIGSAAKGLTYGEIPSYDGAGWSLSGTSIFDPVLCEIAYRWFSPSSGVILDPFAGGSVRGIVASKLGRQYIGHELRAEQVAANVIQGDAICGDEEFVPAWICGDSRNIDKTCADVDADMVFSCPPYADLEVYSDDPSDLSTMKYDDFKVAYFEIIKKACDRLRPDSFACFVVGEVRDKKGSYIDFVGDTVQAFRDAGLEYYNEAILITCVGSLPIRAGKQFSASRKLGKTHQNILVFVKGDGKRAATRCGVVEVDESMLDALEEEAATEQRPYGDEL